MSDWWNRSEAKRKRSKYQVVLSAESIPLSITTRDGETVVHFSQQNAYHALWVRSLSDLESLSRIANS